MAPKGKRKRVDEPRLDDDANWLKLPKAHHILSELLEEDTPFFYYLGKRHLFEALRSENEELSCMRKSRTNPIRRERVHAPFWPDFKTLEKALSSSTSISRTKDPEAIFGWGYYVWKPHFDQLRSQIEQNVRAHGEPPGPTPAPPLPAPAPTPAPAPAPAPPQPQQRKRAQGGGSKPKLRESQIEEGKQFYRDMLAEDPTWTKKVASAPHLKEKLNLGVSCRTVERHIIDPVLKECLTK
jgi:hypothetical protein